MKEAPQAIRPLGKHCGGEELVGASSSHCREPVALFSPYWLRLVIVRFCALHYRPFCHSDGYLTMFTACGWCHRTTTRLRSPKKKLDDGWPESEKGKDVDVKYIEERRRCEKISEERMNI